MAQRMSKLRCVAAQCSRSSLNNGIDERTVWNSLPSAVRDCTAALHERVPAAAAGDIFSVVFSR